jgi:lysophospholipase L1-like esterase
MQNELSLKQDISSGETQHHPLLSLAFGICVFIVLGGICYVFPEKGINMKVSAADSLVIKFPSLASLFKPKEPKKDISAIINAANEADTSVKVIDVPLDSNKTIDTTNAEAKVLLTDTVKKKLITNLQYNNISSLSNFFESLISLKAKPDQVRVLHYGDSQIEADRITDYLRSKLQGQFGGQGPGLFSLMPISPSVTNKITWGPGWDRYNIFTMKDKRVSHSNYGVLAGFTRFVPYRKISDTTSSVSSNVKIVTTKLGGSNATGYKKIKLFYGGAQAKTWCEFYDGPALSGADSLEKGGYFNVKEYKVGLGSLSHEFKFSGKDSPDFYAVSLESDHGVMVDNIALRGSSGTFFHQINPAQMRQFYDYLNVKLIILQFGGNALPAIKDGTMAANYGGYIKGQISTIKKMAPNASIIFIGPADMSVKEGTGYVTHPQLEATRDAIKKAAMESGCAFFDMYDCMGGKNSMVSWVDEKLAATDYIHFSPQGARKIATLFYSALINEYNAYLKSR